MFNSLFVTFNLIALSYGSTEWPNHDISTLKLLQIVHRHGDRTPLDFAPNDPFKGISYWREGIGQLTTKGKYRMYKLGQNIRKEYDSYLGPNYSPREVYARSSVSSRCIESLSCLLSGAYPPKPQEWQWNNGSDAELGQLWQPIPIETFMPKHEDIVLKQEKYCHIVDRERNRIYKSFESKKSLENYRELFANLSEVVGYKVDSIRKARRLHTTLRIEMERGLYWNHVWTKEEEEYIVEQLLELHRLSYRLDYDSSVIRRLRAGGLVKELIKNFERVLKKKNNKKLYIYSTHDSMITVLMHALNIFNDNIPPFGATLLFELHQNSSHINDEYFVKVYYNNQTLNGRPHALSFGDCDDSYECGLKDFVSSTKHLLYKDFKRECNSIDDFEDNSVLKTSSLNKTAESLID
jgi:prostatic aicd phosphatase